MTSMRSAFLETVLPLVAGKTALGAGSGGHSYSGRNGYKTWNFAVLGDAETYLAAAPYEVVLAGDLIERAWQSSRSHMRIQRISGRRAGEVTR
jgi:hypothetical protein